VIGQIIAHTIGGWLPLLLVFSLPMALFAPLIGIDILPMTVWFFPSLLLCISLGFAFDIIFTCVTVRMKGQSWLVYSIRMAIAVLFSGTMIPFQILPFGLATVFEFQPFGSLGGAPLSLFVGITSPARIIVMQVVWNIALWPIAILWFKKSKERQVGYGG
jgi:ABC-2 type transport system permease protein